MIALILLGPGAAWAGGSNYAISPGARPQLEGKISEWPVPTPKYARDPAPGPDGNIYITVKLADKIARFDPRTKRFTEWNVPAGAQPQGLLVDRHGQVWYTQGAATGPLAALTQPQAKWPSLRLPLGATPTRWSLTTTA